MARAIYVEPVDALPAGIDYVYGFGADGPDYGTQDLAYAPVGPIPAIPGPVNWQNKRYIPPNPIIFDDGSNFGLTGPAHVRGNKWQANIDCDVNFNPVETPQWNAATPQGLFHLKVDNADQYARWQVLSMPTDPGVPAPIPVDYASAGASTLYGGK